MNFICSVSKSCDKLPTSLVYLDTSVNPNKFLGHVLVYKAYEENAVKFDYGKYFCFIVPLSKINIYRKIRVQAVLN